MNDPRRGRRWEIIGSDGPGDRWRWRLIGVDEAIVMTSGEELCSFGHTLLDAMQNGFSSKKDHWVVKQHGWVTHFAPGKSPITVTPSGDVVMRDRETAKPRRPSKRAKPRALVPRNHEKMGQ